MWHGDNSQILKFMMVENRYPLLNGKESLARNQISRFGEVSSSFRAGEVFSRGGDCLLLYLGQDSATTYLQLHIPKRRAAIYQRGSIHFLISLYYEELSSLKKGDEVLVIAQINEKGKMELIYRLLNFLFYSLFGLYHQGTLLQLTVISKSRPPTGIPPSVLPNIIFLAVLPFMVSKITLVF